MHSSTGTTAEFAPPLEPLDSALGFRDETFVGDRRGAAAFWAYFSSPEKQDPSTYWDVEVITNPDGYVELSFKRAYTFPKRAPEEAFAFKGNLELMELRQFAHMLQVVIRRLESSRPAETKWQDYSVTGVAK